MPTTAELITAVRRRAMRPDAAADGAISDLDILALGNEELALRIVPLVSGAREDYWISTSDYAIAAGRRYWIPERASFGALRDVTIVDSNGNEQSIPRFGVDDRLADLDGRVGFRLEGNNIILASERGVVGQTLRIRYVRAHPGLVETTSARRVTANGTTGGTTFDSFTISDWPSNWQPNPWRLDAVWSNASYGPALLDMEVDDYDAGSPTLVTLSTPSTELMSVYLTRPVPPSWYDISGSPLPQMWLTQSLTTPVVDLPLEVYPLLVSALAVRVLEVVGDRDGAAIAAQRYAREEENVAAMMEPRVTGATRKIINRHSHLRGGGWR